MDWVGLYGCEYCGWERGARTFDPETRYALIYCVQSVLYLNELAAEMRSVLAA